MRRVSNVPWEMWSILLVVIGIAVIPIILGTVFFKIFREFKPLEVPKETTLATLGYEKRDGFFKKLFFGWVIFVPIALGLYYLALQEI